jgi:hypothetical protein
MDRAWLPESLLAKAAVLITIFVGLFTIGEKVWGIAVGAYHQLRVWSHWPIDRKVFKFLKVNNHGRLYEAKEIAEAIEKKQRTVAESLLRLSEKKKVQQFQDSLWGLHDFEQ